MSTPCKITISESYPLSQALHEISWLNREIEKVKEQMKKRPSKQRHLNDLLRRLKDKEEILNRK